VVGAMALKTGFPGKNPPGWTFPPMCVCVRPLTCRSPKGPKTPSFTANPSGGTPRLVGHPQEGLSEPVRCDACPVRLPRRE
jgi:hypothetical protein